MVSYDVDGAIVTNCVVEFIGPSFPVPTSTAIDNIGTGGATYDGTAADNDYLLAQSGAQTFKMSDATDIISVPHGASIDNFVTATWEIGFYLNAVSGTHNMYLVGKVNSSNYGFRIYLDYTDGSIIIWRDGSTSVYRAYGSGTGLFSAGHRYYVAVTWDCTGYASAPVVYISTDGGAPSSKTMYHISSGTVTAWLTDATGNMSLANRATDSARATDLTLYFYRYHSCNSLGG